MPDEEINDRLQRFSVRLGIRLREARRSRGMSLEQLGEELGISNQQVQKYELAQNRISAARLHDIARVLGVSASYLLSDSARGDGERTPAWDGSDEECASLVSAYSRIPDAAVRGQIRGIVDAMARVSPPSPALPPGAGPHLPSSI